MAKKNIDIAKTINLAQHQPGSPFIKSIIEQASKCNYIVVDCLAGFGGVTEGFFDIPSNDWFVIACINHSPVAIYNHALEFPNCLHLLEDFRTADLSLVAYMIAEIQKLNPYVEVHGWFSFECTNFSNAKGGMPRDEDSRTLADHLDIYIKTLDLDHIWVENVREFLLWGPMLPKVVIFDKGKVKQLFFSIARDKAADFFEPYINAGVFPSCPLVAKTDKKTKDKWLIPWMVPDPVNKGRDFKRWKQRIEDFGYQCEYKLMNCADYGVPQHRIRLIMQFTRGEAPLWPEKTHDKKGRNGLPRWIPVKDYLDLDDEGESVLEFIRNKDGSLKLDKHGRPRPRIKSKKTMVRLQKGTTKHALNRREAHFIAQVYSGDPNGTTPSVNVPSRAITAKGGNLYIAKTQSIDLYYQNADGASLDNASPCIPGADITSLVTTNFIVDYNHSSTTNGINQQSNAVLGSDKLALGTVQHIDLQYSGPENNQSMDDAAAAVTKNPPHALITTQYVDQQYSNGQQEKSIDETSGALTKVPKQKLVSVEQFVMDTQFNNGSHALTDTAGTVTGNRKHFYIISAQFNNLGKSIEETSATIIASMDKKPPYLIVTETGDLAIEVYDYDPPHYVEMKKFMAENRIIRISMRMLNQNELMRIQSLNEHRKIEASQTDVKLMIGNAVPKKLVVCLGEAHANRKKSRQLKLA